jgi:glycosyltransferase involved in cell wall biosynthesis
MISVLMSVYSGESPEAFTAALQSLTVQTTPPGQIVLVKDGVLPDALNDVIRQYRGVLPLDVLPLKENVGLAAALNAGLTLVRHPWIMRFDTDDICAPNRIETQASLMKLSRYDLFGSQIAEFIDDPAKPVSVRSVPIIHDDIVRFALRRNPFNHMTVCYRTDLITSVGGYPSIPFMEDYALWMRMLRAGALTCNDDRTLVMARKGNGMIRRRGGLRYVRSEFMLQTEMVRLGFKGIGRAALDGTSRAAVFLSPTSLRSLVYDALLRSRASGIKES